MDRDGGIPRSWTGWVKDPAHAQALQHRSAHSSIEALLKRISSGYPVGSISPMPLQSHLHEARLPVPGEVIYRDDASAMGRGFNGREAQRTMLTEGTTDAVLILEPTETSRLTEFEAH